jgi:7,8-dihydropterin-6-yl-methyl-4-(beta-D-ribofuranosyl)aminobenzene 5'-phosphate synthase
MVMGIVPPMGIIPTAVAPVKITVIFNNLAYNTLLRTSWGFSCLLETAVHTILFDAGGDGEVLLSNMKHLAVDLRTIDLVVVSHIHADHTGGLQAFLQLNPRVTTYLPESFPAAFQQAIKSCGVDVRTVGAPVQLSGRVFSSGEMGEEIREQALILDTAKGLIVITGCAHPGVVKVVRKAKQHLNRDVYLLMGGLHLKGMSSSQVQGIITMLKEMGVKKVAPSHCTGELTMALFREAWGDNFLEGGVGAIIEAVP